MADEEQIKNKFLEKLEALLKDVLTLDVSTYVTTAEGEGDIELPVPDHPTKFKATLVAHTHIEIDADTVALLPIKKTGADMLIQEKVYEIHKEHVAMAQKTRQEMLNAMLGAVKTVTELGG